MNTEVKQIIWLSLYKIVNSLHLKTRFSFYPWLFLNKFQVSGFEKGGTNSNIMLLS